MKIASHLRDQHSYSLAESVKWAPWQMERIHAETHRVTDCGHEHKEEGQ